MARRRARGRPRVSGFKSSNPLWAAISPIDILAFYQFSFASKFVRHVRRLLTSLTILRTARLANAPFVVVMQRVHIDDLTGFLLSQSDEWDVLGLPAIAESDEAIPLSAERTYRRQSGEALSPKREPLEVLDALKLQIGSDAFSAQYQQAPAPPGGAMVKRHWIKRYSELPPTPARLFTLQSWDTASKGGPDNDWSVCTTWIVTRNKLWYLIDVWRQRVDYTPRSRQACRPSPRDRTRGVFWLRTPAPEPRLFKS